MYETLELGIEEWVRERKKAKGIFDKTLEFRVGEVEIPLDIPVHPMAYVGSSDGGEIYINGVGLEPQLLVLHDLVQEVLYEVLNFTQELGFRPEGLKRERVWRDEVKARESFREFWVLSLKGLGKRRIGVEYLIAYPTKRRHNGYIAIKPYVEAGE
jgi:hypothetical protein